MSREISEEKFSELLEEQVLNSELLRIKIFTVIFGVGIIIFTVIAFLFKGLLFSIYTDRVPHFLLPIYFSIVFLYFYLLKKRVEFIIRSKRKIPLFLRYLSTFVETSIPLGPLLVFSFYLPEPAYVLDTPPVQAFYFFIILSALRLDFKLCVFSGIVASLEYFILSHILIRNSSSELLNPILKIQSITVAKSLIYIIVGIVTGLITSQIQNKIKNSFEALRERERITNLFGQHVSPIVVDKLLNQPTGQESEVLHVCILFFDIRGFTSFSEKRDPKEVINYLNYLFDFIIEIINQHNGIINKFLGDGFMAVFGAPISSGQDVQNAVDASIEIKNRIKKEVEMGKLAPTKIGIGLHAGLAMTGNVGSQKRKEYTIIGDVVNLASRIEQLNKEFHTEILASEEVNNSLQKGSGKFIAEVNVKGRIDKVKIYEIGEDFLKRKSIS